MLHTSVTTCTRHPANHRDATVSQTTPIMLPFFVRCQAQPQLSTTASYRHIFDTPWASGDAHIHTRRFTPEPTELPYGCINSRWCVEQRRYTDRGPPRCSSAFLKTKKNMNASKPSNQSNGLGGTIGCNGSLM